MKLSDVVSELHNARAAHKAWVAHAEALVAGMPLEKKQSPILPTDCTFGQWYYGPGQMLRRLPAYKALEKPHDKLHQTYMKIFKLLFEEPDISALGRLFGQAKKAKAAHVKEAELLIPALRDLSDEVCGVLENLEIQVMSAARKEDLRKTTESMQITQDSEA